MTAFIQLLSFSNDGFIGLMAASDGGKKLNFIFIAIFRSLTSFHLLINTAVFSVFKL